MSEGTLIEWAHNTFNPWWGCAKVSPACDHCYAERDAGRFQPGKVLWGVDAGRREFGDKHWNDPIRWNARAARTGVRESVFCASMADVFDKNAPQGARERLWALILATPRLDWLLLTKRIGNARRMLPAEWLKPGRWPANVRIGATFCNQEEVDRDMGKLLALDVPNFASIEPMLGAIDLTRVRRTPPDDDWTYLDNALTGFRANKCGGFDGKRLDWVIVGGESGPEARPMHPDWATSLRDQCAATGTPFMFKQWGEWRPISQMDEAEHGALYRSRVKAKPHESQDALDESYGRECTVPVGVVHADGSLHSITEPMAFLVGTQAMQAFKVGKKAAGRLLGGQEHNGVPA